MWLYVEKRVPANSGEIKSMCQCHNNKDLLWCKGIGGETGERIIKYVCGSPESVLISTNED